MHLRLLIVCAAGLIIPWTIMIVLKRRNKFFKNADIPEIIELIACSVILIDFGWLVFWITKIIYDWILTGIWGLGV